MNANKPVSAGLLKKMLSAVLDRLDDITNGKRTEVLVTSSTEGSTKRFAITVDDSGTLSVAEVK